MLCPRLMACLQSEVLHHGMDLFATNQAVPDVHVNHVLTEHVNLFKPGPFDGLAFASDPQTYVAVCLHIVDYGVVGSYNE